MRFPYPQRWHSTNRRRRYRTRLIQRVIKLLVLLLLVTVAISLWVRSATRTPTRGIHWGEVPVLARPAARPAAPELPYQIQTELPWTAARASTPPPVPSPVSLSATPRSLAPAVSPPPGVAPSAVKPESAKPAEKPVPAPALVSPADSMQQWIESLLPAILESTLPVFIRVAMDRLDRMLEVAGEKDLSRRFTDTEFRRVVIDTVQAKSGGQISDLSAEIHGDGFHSSGTVNLGNLKLIISATTGIQVVEQRPHILLKELRVGSFEISSSTLRLLEKQMNRTIDSQQYPLLVKEFRFNEGWVWMAVERT